MEYLPLTQLPKRVFAKIEHLRLTEHLRHNLMSLGIIEGLNVRVLHTGLIGGDPIAIEIEGHTVSIRKSDAANILVSRLDGAL